MKPEKGLYPAEPRARAVVDQWNWRHGIHLGPAMNRVNFERFLKPRFGMGEPDEAAIARASAQVTLPRSATLPPRGRRCLSGRGKKRFRGAA